MVKGGTKYQPKSKNEVVDKVKKGISNTVRKIMRRWQPTKEETRGWNMVEVVSKLKMQDQKKQLKADAQEMGYGDDTKRLCRNKESQDMVVKKT